MNNYTPCTVCLPRRGAIATAGIFNLALALFAPPAFAASTDTWVGTTGSNFSTSANWTYSSGSGPVATGDSLLFSGGAGSTTPNNDETGFTFASITFTNTTVYNIGGNAFTMSGGGITNGGAVIQTINNNITLVSNSVSSNGVIVNPVVSGSTITLGGVISGNGNYTKTGNSSSTNILTGVNTFTGVLTFDSGTVIFTTPPSASGGNLGNPSGITFGGSSTTTLLTTAGAGNVTISSPAITVNASSTALFKNGGASGTVFQISAQITGAGNCKQNTPITIGAIVEFSNNANNYTGSFSTAAGIIEYTSVANGGSASSLGAGTGTYAIANSSSAVTFRYEGSGATSTTRNIDWQGTTGGLTLDNGPTASGPAVAFLGSGNLRSGAGTAVLTLTGSSTGANTLAEVINDGVGSGTTSVTANGTGTWVLDGVNTYSGGTTISAGTLQLGSGATLGASTGALNMSGGLLDLGSNTQSLGTVTISGATTLQDGTITPTGFSSTVASGAASITANLAGVGITLSHTGLGNLALLGANTYTGGTTIGADGTLVITNDTGLGNSTNGLTFTASGFLATSNYAAAASNNVTVGSARIITINSGVTAGFATLDTNNLTIASQIVGAGAVTRKGSSFALGTVRFSGDTSTYTGDFTAGFGNTEFTSVANQGTPSSLGEGATATGGTITLNNASSSGTLRYVGSGNSATLRPLNWLGTTATYTLDASGGGTIQFLATNALRSQTNAGGLEELRLRGTSTGSNVFGQVINDSTNGYTYVSKFDAGTWVLTAANTFTGYVTNDGGKLVINGSIGGMYVTNVGGSTLAGTGTINCPVSVGSGTTLVPGSGTGSAGPIGTMTINGNLTNSGTVSMTINSTNAQTASLVTGISTLAYGGTLVVSNTGPALVAGNTFTLFTAANYAGSFATLTLPSLNAGLVWDTSQLPVSGTIRVAALPSVTVTPATTNLVYGGSVTLTANATGTVPLIYQWYDYNTNAIGGATNSTLVLTPSVAQSGTYSVVVTNIYGNATNTASVTVSVATLSVTASNQSKTYGQTVTFGSGSTNFASSGLQNGETIGSVTLAVSGSGGASNAPVSGSPYTITPSAATGGTFNANNYAISYNTGLLTVGPATLTVTADNYSIPFGATNPVFAVTYSNFVNGEILGTSDVGGSPLLTTAATTNSDVGNYVITNGIGTLTSTNYIFNLVNGTLTITNAVSTNAVAGSPNPALPGALATFTSTLSTLTPSMAVPTNTVQFQIDNVPTGGPVYPTNGVATMTNASLSHGYHTIEADYAGDTNALGATNILGSTNTVVELINTPPVAGTAYYQRPPNATLIVPISSLLTNATDADGDPITLVSVTSPSTNGATVTSDTNNVYYVPPATNGNVTDAFLYTVTDSYGATNEGTVVVTVTESGGPSVNITGITTLGNGTALINFAGIPGYTYLIQATTNLTPTIIWTTLSTNTAGTNGLFQYNDLDSTNYPGRYYRTATP